MTGDRLRRCCDQICRSDDTERRIRLRGEYAADSAVAAVVPPGASVTGYAAYAEARERHERPSDAVQYVAADCLGLDPD